MQEMRVRISRGSKEEISNGSYGYGSPKLTDCGNFFCLYRFHFQGPAGETLPPLLAIKTD